MRTAEVVIIGGGIHGCALAYNLAKKGLKEVVLLEKNTLASGGTGRSAAGIRHQFGTEINCQLAAESICLWEKLAGELEYEELEFVQEGYLMLAYSNSQAEQLKKNVKMQNDLGIEDSVFLSREEVGEVFPGLNLNHLIGASFNPRDGHVNPFHATRAYARAAQKKGVELELFSRVISLKELKGEGFEVRTAKEERIRARKVVNAAGPWGKELATFLGIDIPLYPERHQIMVTEPAEIIRKTMVISFEHGTYFKQTPRGNFLIGLGDPSEVKEFNQSSTWQFLESASSMVVLQLPFLKDLRIIRQWAGLYDITPDHQAIIGETEKEGFYLNLGWSGHGFQLAPIISELMAADILGDDNDKYIDLGILDYGRFDRNELVFEPACV